MRPFALMMLALALLPAASSVAPPEAACPERDEVGVLTGHPLLAFDPPCVRVAPGGTLAWVNNAEVAIAPQARSPSGAPLDAPCFDAGDIVLLEPGGRYAVQFLFDAAGRPLARFTDVAGHALTRDCSASVDPALSSEDVVTLHYRDAAHAGVRGYVALVRS